MRTLCYSTKPYDRRSLESANAAHGHDLRYTEAHLNADTAALAKDFPCVCAFVNDQLNAPALRRLREGGTRLVALRSAGYNHVDLQAAAEEGIQVVRVPEYSPQAVAEHTLALILSMNRHIHRAFNRVREGNFALEGLLGFDMHARTVGIVGTGRIGTATLKILSGFGCSMLAYDPIVNSECETLGVRYVPLHDLLAQSDIVSLHCPLTPDTLHLIDDGTLALMRHGAMLVNTGRGALIDTKAAIKALKSGRLGYLCLDVYEEEADLFFEDCSDRIIQDDIFMRLLTFPNVLVTGHQAFFTAEALAAIASTTLENITAFESRGEARNGVVSFKEKPA